MPCSGLRTQGQGMPCRAKPCRDATDARLAMVLHPLIPGPPAAMALHACLDQVPLLKLVKDLQPLDAPPVRRVDALAAPAEQERRQAGERWSALAAAEASLCGHATVWAREHVDR